MDGILFSVYLSVHEPLCALRLEKHGLMDGWRSWSRGKDIKGIDNKDETLDMFWFGHERLKDSGGIWMAPEAPFPPFFPRSLSLRLLFHTSRIKYNQSFHIFFPPLWDVEREKQKLGYCIGMSWVCDVILWGWILFQECIPLKHAEIVTYVPFACEIIQLIWIMNEWMFTLLVRLGEEVGSFSQQYLNN